MLSFAVATYLIYMKYPGVLGGLLLGEQGTDVGEGWGWEWGRGR